MTRIYQNGNSIISIFENGTREILFEEGLKLEFPLNLDIRVQSKCKLGLNEDTGKSVCSFCHESATTTGEECNYEDLVRVLRELPRDIELAIGCNYYSYDLRNFLIWCRNFGFMVNLTVNQITVPEMEEDIGDLIESGVVSGLGVSYRSSHNLPFLDYKNTIYHVISGIDTFEEVEKLSKLGVNKILVLGEKDFGFNLGKVDLSTKNHKEWFWNIRSLFEKFEVVSFDNLAVEQLNIRRFFKEEKWDELYQGEHSFYINAVDKSFSVSSRSNEKTSWSDISGLDFFKKIEKEA